MQRAGELGLNEGEYKMTVSVTVDSGCMESAIPLSETFDDPHIKCLDQFHESRSSRAGPKLSLREVVCFVIKDAGFN